jgi:methylene-fatty-acyl-phospholipid synthase
VNAKVFALAVLLLSLERIYYAWIWHSPHQFHALCATRVLRRAGRPPDVLRYSFYACKVLQGAVFLVWFDVYGHGSWWPDHGPLISLLGVSLIIVGQLLNVSVFRRLGNLGVFYGERLGYAVPWTSDFPFSLLDHPQYAGTMLSIWGLFLVMRFPNEDWYALPAVETLFYALSAYQERTGGSTDNGRRPLTSDPAGRQPSAHRRGETDR